jgi:hypothetical protein
MVRNALKGIDPWKAIDQAWAEGREIDLSGLEVDIAEAVKEVRRQGKK